MGSSNATSTTPSAEAAAAAGGPSSSSVFSSRSAAHWPSSGYGAPPRIRSQAGTMLECPSSMR